MIGPDIQSEPFTDQVAEYRAVVGLTVRDDRRGVIKASVPDDLFGIRPETQMVIPIHQLQPVQVDGPGNMPAACGGDALATSLSQIDDEHQLAWAVFDPDKPSAVGTDVQSSIIIVLISP